MKKMLMLTILICLVITGSSYAGEGVSMPPFNLNADTLYLPMSGDFAVGVGYTIATFKDMFELRAETAYIASETAEKKTFFGAGIGLNVKKAIERAGGTWAMSSISPTVGGLLLYDATSVKKFIPAIYVSLVKIEF